MMTIVMSICNCEFGCNGNLNVIEFLSVDVYVGVYVCMRVNVGVWIRMRFGF